MTLIISAYVCHIHRSVCDEALDFMKSHGCSHVMVLESLIVFSVLGIIVNLLKVSYKAVCSRIKSNRTCKSFIMQFF